MKLIKLSATSSTNDYLKEWSRRELLTDLTVVWAKHQSAGRGQMGSTWDVDTTKNLTFSVLIANDKLQIEHMFTLNVMVANAVHRALSSYSLENIKIKWPNDILSYQKKIGGILIENTLQSNGKFQSIVGIGINVSQTQFDHLPKASSILKQYQKEIDQEELLSKIVQQIADRVYKINEISAIEWQYYHKHLFRKGELSHFITADNETFCGIIDHVTSHGQLVVIRENQDCQKFSLKEIKLVY